MKYTAKITFYVILNAFWAVTAQASSIMFSGVVDYIYDNSNVWNSDIYIGAPISGTITYNSIANPRTFSSTTRDYGDGVNIRATFTIGTSTWSFSNSDLYEGIEVKNTIPEDRFELDAVGTNPDSFPSFLGQYNFQFDFRESSILLDLFNSPELPQKDGDVNFEDAEFISGNFQNEGGLQFAAFTFQIDSNNIALSSVPEPNSVALIFGNSILLFALFSRK